ncbi:MAG: hypothetical protein M3065_16100 [Actinomycetota bacterium]|nr:hypothetical protein [Actinomycetota bacterium]
MKRLTVYEKPTCTTCRRLAALLSKRGIEFERVDYLTLRALVLDPELLQRPIVECGDRAVLARPPEKAFDLVDPSSAGRNPHARQ